MVIFCSRPSPKDPGWNTEKFKDVYPRMMVARIPSLILKLQTHFEITQPLSELFQVLDRALKILDEMPEQYRDF